MIRKNIFDQMTLQGKCIIFYDKQVEDATQLTPVIEHENESDSTCDSSESKSCSVKGKN